MRRVRALLYELIRTPDLFFRGRMKRLVRRHRPDIRKAFLAAAFMDVGGRWVWVFLASFGFWVARANGFWLGDVAETL